MLAISNYSWHSYSVVVSISACHEGDLCSIIGNGVKNLIELKYRTCTTPTVVSNGKHGEIHRELDLTTKTKLTVQSRQNTA